MWAMEAPAATGGVPSWVQIAVGILGVLGGPAALAAVFLQRRKLRADATGAISNAAGEITDAAMQLIEPLRTRITELDKKVRVAEASAATATAELDQTRRAALEATAALQEATATLRAWRAAILSPTATLAGLRHMVAADPGVGQARNGWPT